MSSFLIEVSGGSSYTTLLYLDVICGSPDIQNCIAHEVVNGHI